MVRATASYGAVRLVVVDDAILSHEQAICSVCSGLRGRGDTRAPEYVVAVGLKSCHSTKLPTPTNNR